MHTLKSALAIGFAALLLSTTLAGAVSTLPQTGEPMTHLDVPVIDNSKPAPEFGNGDKLADNGVLIVSPYTSSCTYVGHDKAGRPRIDFVNMGTATIPAGSIYTVTWPDGTTESFKTPWDIAPGGSFGILGPANADQPGFDCSVHVKVKKPDTHGH